MIFQWKVYEFRSRSVEISLDHRFPIVSSQWRYWWTWISSSSIHKVLHFDKFWQILFIFSRYHFFTLLLYILQSNYNLFLFIIFQLYVDIYFEKWKMQKFLLAFSMFPRLYIALIWSKHIIFVKTTFNGLKSLYAS